VTNPSDGSAPPGQTTAAAHETLVAVRVRCDAGHPLTGLFVIWAPAEGAKGQNRTESAKAGSPEAKIIEIGEQYDPVNGVFTVAFVDKSGYLQPVRPGVNPWRETFVEDRNPTTLKLVQAQYRVCLLRHPSPALAFALAGYLNKKDDDFDCDAWGGKEMWTRDTKEVWKAENRASLLQQLPFTLADVKPPPNTSADAPKAAEQPAKELVLELEESEENEIYWPQGHKLYKGWTLYCDMPHRNCPDLRTQVKRAQAHLGALRYPIGIQERPYFSELKKGDDPTNPKAGYERGNRGIFDLRTTAALARFQEHAQSSAAFRVGSEGAHAHDKLVDTSDDDLPPVASYKDEETWSYLLGEPLTELPTDCHLTTYSPGLLDWRTADSIKHWIRNHLRKPGPILLRVKGTDEAHIYLREDAAIQVEVWRQLVNAFGCSEDLLSGHSFREVDQIVRNLPGVLNNSIHKSGLAIDLAIKGYVHPVDGWPIRVEQRFVDLTVDPLKEIDQKLEKLRKERKDADARLAGDQPKAGAAPPSGASSPTPGAAPPDHSVPAAAAAPSSSPPPGPAAAPPNMTEKQAHETSRLALGKANDARDTAAKAPQPAYAPVVQADRDYIAALDQEKQVLERERDRLKNEKTVTKNLYGMRWCLYGHSTLDMFGKPADSLADLKKRLDALPDDIRKHLRSLFKPPNDDKVNAWIDRFCAGKEAYLDIEHTCAALKDVADLKGAHGLMETCFRESLKPFLFDPLEKDGGSSLTTDLYPEGCGPDGATHDDAAWAKSNQWPAAKPGAKCYVNLSRLAWHCRMFAIGTAGKGWKQTVEAKRGFQTLVEYIKKFNDWAKKHPEDKNDTAEISRGKGQPHLQIKIADLDDDFMDKWEKLIAELPFAAGSPKPAKRHKPSGPKSPCFTVDAPRVTLVLPTKATQPDADRLLEKLKGDFGSKQFFVVSAGKSTGLAALAKTALQGSQLAAKLDSAIKDFQKALADAQKGKEGTPSPAAAPPASANPAALERLVSRQRSWFEISVQPHFVKGSTPLGDLSNVPFLPKDAVQVPAPGVPRTLEWWHFQSKFAAAKPWMVLLEDVGFSKEVLLAAEVPSLDYGKAIDGRGLGYTHPEMESTRGGTTWETAPSNIWAEPPDGW
jgi:hypothetical protein